MQTKERELFIDEEIVRHDIRRIKGFPFYEIANRQMCGWAASCENERHLFKRRIY